MTCYTNPNGSSCAGLPYAGGTSVGDNGDPFTANVVSVEARWPGAALSVVWQNVLIDANTQIQVTAKTDRIRIGFTVTAGQATITRSSGTTADERFVATIVSGVAR